MQNIYPLFERNRVLKKELLWALRDYSFAYAQLEYQGHGPGMVRGCTVSVEGKELAVGPGTVKCGGFICLRQEEERLPFAPADGVQYVKLGVEVGRLSQDYVAYKMGLYIDMEGTLKENEFEVCRFHLRKGAQLRHQYTGFADMDTEYDTVHLLGASWGGLGGKALAPAITRGFAEAALASGNAKPEDRSFAHLCLCQPGAVPMAVVSDYVNSKGKPGQRPPEGNRETYGALRDILKGMGQGAEKSPHKGRERHRILVD